MLTKRDFIIGLDSGGTNLRIGILFPQTDRTFHKNFKSISLNHFGVETFCNYLLQVLNRIVNGKKFSWSDCIGICAAIAGARNENIKKNIKEYLKSALNFKNIVITSDAEAIIYYLYRDKDGAILISGTGSVIYAKINNKIIRTGGWGRIIGDVGSGYEIGRTILQKLVSEYDMYNGKVKTDFLSKLEKKFKFSSNNLVEKIYLKNFNISLLTHYVIQLAEIGDNHCQKLLKEQASKLIQQLNIFIRANKVKGKLNLTLCGGLLQNENYYSKLIKQQIKTKFKNKFVLIEKKFSPLKGSLQIAFDKFVKNKT
ncbi:MAG: hypothetical protein N2490_05140 [Ignavibacteria bacterium]|nr:hypothetical protein [Ignavibacteria bacterium]